MAENRTERLRGIFPAMLTMFDAEGNLDESGTWDHADWLIRQGVHGLVAAGTSGEFIALDDEERRSVIEIAIDAARGRVPVVASTGYYSTRKTVATTQWAEAAGADAALVVLPYYQKPPKSGVMEHYRTVRRHSGIPVLAYNIPANSACAELTPWDLAQLSREGVVQGVKSTFPSTSQVSDLSLLCPADFRIFYGSFRCGLQAFAVGASGWISGFLNFVPAEAVKLYEACVVQKDLDKAREIWRRMVPFVHLYVHPRHGQVNDLALWRAGLELRGRHGGHSRLPFLPLTEEQREDLAATMQQVGLPLVNH
jgi:dihydrodipicolinate synthase/N-acetylneuraminate lyase